MTHTTAAGALLPGLSYTLDICGKRLQIDDSAGPSMASAELRTTRSYTDDPLLLPR